MKSFNQSRRMQGFTLIELLVVVTIIGVLAYIGQAYFRGGTHEAKQKQLNDFFQTGAGNWYLLNEKCGTTSDTSGSPVVATPSSANALGLIVNGSSFLNSNYAGCYTASGIVPLIGKATGNPTNGFTVAGYPVTWSGGGTGNPIAFASTIPTELALIFYKEYSSVDGARNATALNSGGDASDPKIRYSAPANGTTTITFFVY